jgi:polar amino acid transport system substrate-binding protein
MTSQTLPKLAAALLGSLLAAAIPGAARADTLADIHKAGVLKVGIFEDFPPFASAGADMSLHGYDIDVANALATALGVKLSLVGITGQNRIPYLQEHKVDILLSVGQSPEREKVIDFTAAYAPYYIAVLGPHALAVPDAAALAGKTIAVNRGTLEDTSLTDAAPKTADIKRFDNYNGVITAFLSGQVQLIAVGNDVGASVLARHPSIEPEQKFQLMSSPDHIALNKNEPALKQALDDAIARMRADGSLNKISIQWLQKPLDPKDL